MMGPDMIGEFVSKSKELMYVLYMPVRMKNGYDIELPVNLEPYRLLVEMALIKEGWRANGKYVYLTVKRLWADENGVGGRPGWHTDGFGTNDINYVWCDSQPTEFCIQDFDLSEDHDVSMIQMEEQARHANIFTFMNNSVVRITPNDVHRCPTTIRPGYRSFARVSISKNKYDMEGNAHNHLLNYSWEMKPRCISGRNDTQSN